MICIKGHHTDTYCTSYDLQLQSNFKSQFKQENLRTKQIKLQMLKSHSVKEYQNTNSYIVHIFYSTMLDCK